MIKLIPVPNIDIDDLINNVMSGRQYTRSTSTVDEYNVLHYDKSHIRCPFRYGLKPWDWRGMSELKEITESHWYDNLTTANKVPCIINDVEHQGFLDHIYYYKHDSKYPFQGDYDAYRSVTPLTADDLYQEPV